VPFRVRLSFRRVVLLAGVLGSGSGGHFSRAPKVELNFPRFFSSKRAPFRKRFCADQCFGMKRRETPALYRK